MTAAFAIVLDAYRELNSRKIFWITLAISGMVVLAYGSIGFAETGMSILFGLWHIESEFFHADSQWSRGLYLGIYSDFMVSLWLAWIATILALISTTTIFPDFMAAGSIDLVLSKPISRLRLFVLKYAAGLLFVLMQVTLFCVGIFLCIGLRLGEWKWMAFAAIPLVTVFFSYLFCVNVLIGIVTRSAIAALLLTLLFWFSLWGVQSTENLLHQFELQFSLEAEKARERAKPLEERLTTLRQEKNPDDEVLVIAAQRLEHVRTAENDAQGLADRLHRWHVPTYATLTLLPKTERTIELLSRWLKDPEGFDMTGIMTGEMTGGRSSPMSPDPTQAEVLRRVVAEREKISPWFIIGTSLGFEAVVLVIAGVVFIRRDY